MNFIKNISITDYHYDLPESRIAMFPLEKRDQSKLLVWKNNEIKEDRFINISYYIPEGSLLIYNNSKVIRARLRFEKNNNSFIEIFCLEPLGISGDYALALNAQHESVWKCMVGGLSKWKTGALKMTLQVGGHNIILEATLKHKGSEAHEIHFCWNDEKVSFGELLEAAGEIPLPPYIKRKNTDSDKDRYQTIYANHEGSVAAPTAGLHFTDAVFESFKKKNIDQAFVSLHVGAGTFRPVKAAIMEDHEMHSEWTAVRMETIRQILQQRSYRIAVGTTSLRTLESIYWLGVKVMLQPELEHLDIKQWDVYESPLLESDINVNDALQALMKWMENRKMATLYMPTQLLIAPGYRFRIADALITNFHQPQSTLLLLVAAAMGDQWRTCYQYALEHDFRFLSYGDGSIIFIPKKEF